MDAWLEYITDTPNNFIIEMSLSSSNNKLHLLLPTASVNLQKVDITHGWMHLHIINCLAVRNIVYIQILYTCQSYGHSNCAMAADEKNNTAFNVMSSGLMNEVVKGTALDDVDFLYFLDCFES